MIRQKIELTTVQECAEAFSAYWDFRPFRGGEIEELSLNMPDVSSGYAVIELPGDTLADDCGRKVITVTAYSDYLKAHSAMGSRRLIDGWEVMRVVELPTIPMSWEIHVERPDRRACNG